MDAQAQKKPQSSLVVVQPERFRIQLWRETPPWNDYTQRKTHAVFRYAGRRYSLSVTDPVFKGEHCSEHPAERDGVREFTPPCGDNCLLCISLTPPFKGYHYKVVATVLSIP